MIARSACSADDLVRQSDVFLTNLRPASLAEMGADDKTLQAVNPNLVYAHGTLFGQYGPRPNVPAACSRNSVRRRG